MFFLLWCMFVSNIIENGESIVHSIIPSIIPQHEDWRWTHNIDMPISHNMRHVAKEEKTNLEGIKMNINLPLLLCWLYSPLWTLASSNFFYQLSHLYVNAFQFLYLIFCMSSIIHSILPPSFCLPTSSSSVTIS